MPRDLDSAFSAALASGLIQPFFMAQLTFNSQTEYIWTGVGSLVYDSQRYIGVGSFAKIGSVKEGTDVQAYGTTVTLSGIDPVLLAECMSDIKPGAPAKLWFGGLSNGNIIGAPYLLFSGTMDQPSVSVGVDTISITLALESRMMNLSRATNRRYTSADQRLKYPTDIGFSWVEQLNDLSLRFGS
jgi:hypothetical protein